MVNVEDRGGRPWLVWRTATRLPLSVQRSRRGWCEGQLHVEPSVSRGGRSWSMWKTATRRPLSVQRRQAMVNVEDSYTSTPQCPEAAGHGQCGGQLHVEPSMSRRRQAVVNVEDSYTSNPQCPEAAGHGQCGGQLHVDPSVSRGGRPWSMWRTATRRPLSVQRRQAMVNVEDSYTSTPQCPEAAGHGQCGGQLHVDPSVSRGGRPWLMWRTATRRPLSVQRRQAMVNVEDSYTSNPQCPGGGRPWSMWRTATRRTLSLQRRQAVVSV